MLSYKVEEMTNFYVRCPRCGSSLVEKGKNQEFRCSQCKEVFYFVTPKCGSQLDVKRYEL
jgi:tRNA(Ile2) C34 agmatinyltransferase TiaS